MGLDRLFDLKLRFRPDMGAVVSPEGREGELAGSGDGTLRGPAVQGTIRWSNFETRGERLCGMYPAGLIETDDGAAIRFDAKGYALRIDDAGASSRWSVAGAMRLDTDDARYAWLSQGLAVWEGALTPRPAEPPGGSTPPRTPVTPTQERVDRPTRTIPGCPLLLPAELAVLPVPQ